MLQGDTQRLDLMLAKEGDGLRAGAERLCESDQEAHSCQWSSTKGIVLLALNTVQGVYLCVHRGASEDQRPG